MKNEENDKKWFYPGSRGAQGGEESDLLRDAFFVFAKQIFCWHHYFLLFQN